MDVIQDITEVYFNSEYYYQNVVQTGVLNVVIDNIILIADTQQITKQFNDTYTILASAPQNIENEKQRALVLLVDIWKSNS